MKWIGGLIVFLAELGMFWALMSLGPFLVDGVVGWVLGAAFLVAGALIWSAFLAPKAHQRLPDAPRIVVSTVLLLAGAGVFFAIGQTTLGIVLKRPRFDAAFF